MLEVRTGEGGGGCWEVLILFVLAQGAGTTVGLRIHGFPVISLGRKGPFRFTPVLSYNTHSVVGIDTFASGQDGSACAPMGSPGNQ